MARSGWKGLYYTNSILKCCLLVSIQKKLKFKNKIIFIKSNSIPKNFLGLKFIIYKGLIFKSIKIDKYILGYKFGEFTFTRKPFKFIKKKIKSIIAKH